MIQSQQNNGVLVSRHQDAERIAVRSDADRRWDERGRPHFLNRREFERRQTANTRPVFGSTRTLAIPPFMELVLGLTVLMLPFWAIWQVTRWCCPPVADLFVSLLRALRRMFRYLRQWFYHKFWREPAMKYGTAVGLWMVAVLLELVSLTIALLSGNFAVFGFLLFGLPYLAVLYALLRWQRQRWYRPRPMPRRTRGRNDG